MMKKILLIASIVHWGAIAMYGWTPKQAPLMTEWGERVTAENAHQEYPRPQMVREQWKNLNGLWNYAVTSKDALKPEKIAQGQILVPFAIESALSGVQQKFTPEDKLWYETEFTVCALSNTKHSDGAFFKLKLNRSAVTGLAVILK